jgi:hypothetical protein
MGVVGVMIFYTVLGGLASYFNIEAIEQVVSPS